MTKGDTNSLAGVYGLNTNHTSLCFWFVTKCVDDNCKSDDFLVSITLCMILSDLEQWRHFAFWSCGRNKITGTAPPVWAALLGVSVNLWPILCRRYRFLRRERRKRLILPIISPGNEGQVSLWRIKDTHVRTIAFHAVLCNIFETVFFIYLVDRRDSAMYTAKVAKVLDDIGT